MTANNSLINALKKEGLRYTKQRQAVCDENKSNEFNQKLKDYFNFFQNHIKREIKKTKEFQVKKWKEAKNQNDKTLKIVSQKLTGFFSDFPNPKGDK